MRSPHAASIAVAIVITLSSGHAYAARPGRDARQALEHYERGKQHFVKGDYDQAIAELVAALSYDRKPIYLWNIARAHEKKGDYANARNYFAQYRDVVTAPKEKAAAEEKLLALERLEAARRAVGRLVVRCNVDGARVRIDGQYKGVTPLDELVELSIGEHRVSLERDGYHPLATAVDIEGALTKTVHLELVPLAEHVTGELLLTVRDDGARVRLDGAEVGVGPLERVLTVGVGRHEVTIQREGRLPYVRSIDVTEGERLRLTPELAAIPTGARGDSTLSTWGWILLGAGVVTAGVGAYYLADPPVDTTRTETLTITREDLTPGTVITAVGAAAAGTGILLLILAASDGEDANDAGLVSGRAPRRGSALTFTF